MDEDMVGEQVEKRGNRSRQLNFKKIFIFGDWLKVQEVVVEVDICLERQEEIQDVVYREVLGRWECLVVCYFVQNEEIREGGGFGFWSQ